MVILLMAALADLMASHKDEKILIPDFPVGGRDLLKQTCTVDCTHLPLCTVIKVK